MDNKTTTGQDAGASVTSSKSAAEVEADNMLQRAAQKAHETVDRIAENVQKAHSTVDRVADSVRGAHSTVDKLAEGMQTGTHRVAEFSDEYGEQARSFIRENPLACVAGAFAIGVLYQKLFGR
jgi:ElaB/YqjD/DUF883 family membrane-anchored ribosome-binding protein